MHTLENKLLIIQELSGLRKKGKFEEIVDLCTENLKSDPDNLFLLRANAHAAYEIGKIPAFSVVLTCIEKILEQSPNDIESLILQVRTLRRLNRIDEAKISLELAERIESDNPDLLVQKSGMLINAHRISAAKEVLNRLEKIDPQSAFSHLGVIAWIEKRYNDALHFFSRCLEAEPDNFKAADNKIGLLFEMERYDEAVSIADKFIEKYGERRFRMYRVLAQLHFGISQKFNNKSSAEYDNQPCTFGSRILDESDEKWNDEKFFNTRKKNEHLRKALEIFNEIDEKEIHNPETRYFKALTCIALEDAKLGTDAINDCLEEKENWDILSHQASFLKRQGKNEEAIKICDEILKDYPNDSLAIATKIDALYCSGDLLEYRRLFLKHYPEEKTKLEPYNTEDEPVSENTSAIRTVQEKRYAESYEKFKEKQLYDMKKHEEDDTPSKLKEILDSEKD